MSRYYSQMRKRLLKSISPDEQNEKDKIYFELRDTYPNVMFRNMAFTGSFYKIEQNTFLFIGVDKRLLSYQGFLEFVDYEEDIDETINGNNFLLFKDGVLIIEIKEISEFSDIIFPEKIKSYQENITISDVDVMTKISFEKYVAYLLIQNGFETELEQSLQDFHSDIIGWKNNKKYVFELKLFKRKKVEQISIKQLLQFSKIGDIEKVILITNAEIPERYKDQNEKLILIGRKQLRTILKNKKKFLEIINV